MQNPKMDFDELKSFSKKVGFQLRNPSSKSVFGFGVLLGNPNPDFPMKITLSKIQGHFIY